MLRSIALRRPVGSLTRNVSTLQRNNTSKKGLLVARSVDIGRRNMSGHGPDISKLEAALYILVGGGGFAVFGMYQTMCMRDRIEAFETGKVVPFKSLTDDELLVVREKFKKLHSDEEEEDDDQDPSEIEPEQNKDLAIPRRISMSSKDTIIFLDAPKE